MKQLLAGLLEISSQAFTDETLNSVNARNLHKALGIGRDYATWIKARLQQARFIQGQDFIIVETLSTPKRGSSKYQQEKARPQKMKEYFLTLDTAKHLCLMERNNEQAHAIRTHFINAEKQLSRLQPKAYRNTLAETKARLEAIDHNHELNQAIREWADRHGLGHNPNHYRNEALLLDSLVLGENVRTWKARHRITGNARDYFTPEQLGLLKLLQETDKTLLRLNLNYQQRKAQLSHFAKQQAKTTACNG